MSETTVLNMNGIALCLLVTVTVTVTPGWVCWVNLELANVSTDTEYCVFYEFGLCHAQLNKYFAKSNLIKY